MIIEIEKMTQVQKMATEVESKDIDHIINTLSSDFQQMLNDSRNYLLTGEKVERDWSESLRAMKKMKEYGDKYGVEFPDVETNEQAIVYVLKFGHEIVKHQN